MSTDAKSVPDLKWEDPPEHGNSKSPWHGIAAALRGNPGKWALVSENAKDHLAGNLRSGAVRAFERGMFEVRSSGPTGGPFRVYARYIGGKK